jgi:hypothetical protein
LRQAAVRIPKFAAVLDHIRDVGSFAYTGRGPVALGLSVDSRIDPIVAQGHYAEARKLMAGLPEAEPAWNSYGLNPLYVGRQPSAALRQGEMDLLLGDKDSGARHGKAVLDFVAAQRVTVYNDWFLQLLTASGRLSAGDSVGAVAAAAEAIRLTPRSKDAVYSVYARAWAARIYAAAGKQDDAVAILEELSTSTPGLPPALITRDPRYAVPLAGNARFRTLSAQLEAQMKALKLE